MLTNQVCGDNEVTIVDYSGARDRGARKAMLATVRADWDRFIAHARARTAALATLQAAYELSDATDSTLANLASKYGRV